MQPQRETLTENLADIIQILQIGFRSGTLAVERGEGQGREEGYLVFVNGKVVDSKAGQYTHWSAFQYLKTWRSCRFSFESDTPALLPPAPPSPSMHRNGNGSSSWPANGYAIGGPRSIAPPSFPANRDASQPGSLTRIPVRSPAGDAALLHPDSTGLQRVHRRLLLVINGQRNCDDLARLMARNPDEVQVLLDSLEQAGFIKQ